MILTKKDYEELGHEKFIREIEKFYAEVINNDPTPRTKISKGHCWMAKRHDAFTFFKANGWCDLTKF